MFGFGSSSASSSTPPPASEPTVAPTREQRKHCWESRDAYFACLDKGNVMVAGGTEPGEAGCKAERKGYEVHCGKSWVSCDGHHADVGRTLYTMGRLGRYDVSEPGRGYE